MTCPHHLLAIIDDRIDHGHGTSNDLIERERLQLRIDAMTARNELESIQRAESTHARIGEVIGTRIVVDPKTKRERTIVARRSSFAVCPRCPVRRECRAASARLGAAEAEVLSGGVNG